MFFELYPCDRFCRSNPLMSSRAHICMECITGYYYAVSIAEILENTFADPMTLSRVGTIL